MKNYTGFYSLEPIHESVKSYYGKAEVRTCGGDADLYSYGTLVAGINEDGAWVNCEYDSATTLRHVKEFLKQYGFDAPNKKFICENYGK